MKDSGNFFERVQVGFLLEMKKVAVEFTPQTKIIFSENIIKWLTLVNFTKVLKVRYSTYLSETHQAISIKQQQKPDL